MRIGLLGETRRIRCLGGIPSQPIIGGTLVAGFDLRETPVALGVSRAKKKTRAMPGAFIWGAPRVQPRGPSVRKGRAHFVRTHQRAGKRRCGLKAPPARCSRWRKVMRPLFRS